MAEYKFRDIEKKWQKYWADQHTFHSNIEPEKPKFYALDMFPYPSGAGLHVGHPLGYIATDIVSRYKMIKGYNVLHPMGFDSFGLPAEQYAIQTGQHPAITTAENIKKYKEQLKNIGFCFDWDKEVQTSSPDFYRWTQWIFSQLFESWYDKREDKAKSIQLLIAELESNGNANVEAHCDEDTPSFTSSGWNAFSDEDKQHMLLKYRLAFISEATVNWCPELGTVLSNDEVKDGFSERGGYPVIRKKMPQWSLRITAYADRLLSGLDTIDWPEPVREMQRNWIGKSFGAEVDFNIEGHDENIRVFTTRLDTIYGVTFLVLAPESELVDLVTQPKNRNSVDEYIKEAVNRSERDRMSDVKSISGIFTGGFVIHPFSGEKIPVWIADYVLAGYGTGAVMAVPAGDQRDYDFARHFDLPIIPIIEGVDISEKADPTWNGKMINSGIFDGLSPKEAIQRGIKELERLNAGTSKVNYRMRDAIFGRQRYWGEPFPVYFKDGLPQLIEDEYLPVLLPEVDAYKPTEEGDPPLGRAKDFVSKEGYPMELTTMPGWAGSSWYFFRYMDASNDREFCSKEAQEYWGNVDLYIGGTEHATGHLLYSRFWTKFLYDMGYVDVEEPFQKMINQGMIQGRSNFVYRVKNENKFVSYHLRKDYQVSKMHVDVNIVNNDQLDIEAFKKWRPDLANSEFILEDGNYICGTEVEKMSKSKFNVVNPDQIIEDYGADTLRLYEMFLGPLEQFKPWNTNGIDGVFKFLRKLWRLFYSDEGELLVNDNQPSDDMLRTLHKTLKKIEEDIDRYSFNTSVSSCMICVNELTTQQCHSRKILQDLVISLSPFAPHISEELWQILGNKESITQATYPKVEEKYLQVEAHEYPISVNGKMRAKMTFALDMPSAEIEKQVLASEVIQKWTEGKTPKKVIIIPKRIVNIVV